MNTAQLYADYKTKMQKIADVKYASAVLQWDQETYLPPKGSDIRGRQIATLSEIAHQQFTDEETGSLLMTLNSLADLDDRQKRNVQISLEDYNKNRKLPTAFVRKMSETVNKNYHSWIEARKQNSFAPFQQPLDELIQLKKQEADYLGYEKHPYDALMNDYEKGLTTAITDQLFTGLKPELSTLLDQVKNKPEIDNSFLHQHFDKDRQWKFGIGILKEMNFDFEAGRQDISEHPFTINFNNADVRVTTRIDESDFGNMTWSCLHEGGHALYEQGLPGEEYGLPLGEYCSVSIHESQSRLWENCIGRGLPFWQKHFPSVQKIFPEQFSGIGLEKFYRGINKVQPSLIRTEADEVTYHFHVMIRYEIEKMLIEGSLQTADIPTYWNEHYLRYLGVKVPDDKKGCLQDVHWSHGSFGYFATYSLGSLYAAQFYTAMLKENPSLENEISYGNNGLLHQWLRKHIYTHGRYYTAEELCKKTTGEELDSRYFITYITRKMNNLFSL
jgi:carboxypeptidase Taq